eukprot:TRINITY_DN3566_c0_g1_i3.p1 TRINITY_DN3566_c0_g1~~TRINITY_DN3566_c0_g1_i3.p1  ORF type:complete len:393 (-),score=104.98 TRINITY_DN3566_c0_g1_i3:150-1328(-)
MIDCSISDYLWMAEDGMKMQGYNGSQLWDTAFAVQAISESGLAHKFRNCIEKAHDYIDISQVRVDVDQREKYYRHASKGGWPFSTVDHGWPITDCTAEGMKSALSVRELGLTSKPIAYSRMCDAADLLLGYQNPVGGWATYENTRASTILEWINPSEVFGDIMIDYSYVECSSASLQALMRFRKHVPDYRADEIDAAIDRGIDFIKRIQRKDGSWYGSWGVCFTYGTWFGVEALVTYHEFKGRNGTPYEAIPEVRRACRFLITKQMSDGGWGETFLSCVDKKWSQNKESQVVNTAWAALTLLKAHYPDQEPIAAAIDLLKKRQLPNGDWKQENISGVFNANCMISYTNYRNIFPIWALGVYSKMYEQKGNGVGMWKTNGQGKVETMKIKAKL